MIYPDQMRRRILPIPPIKFDQRTTRSAGNPYENNC